AIFFCAASVVSLPLLETSAWLHARVGAYLQNTSDEKKPAIVSPQALVPVTVFADDFSTDQNSIFTTAGTIGNGLWSVERSGNGWGARRNISPAQLELTHDATSSANANGW